MKITGLNHANITIPRQAEAEARQFYCGVLGLVEIEKPPSLQANGGLWLMAGVMPIHISIEDGFDRHQTRAHLAYEVDDLAAWQNRLESVGMQVQPNIPFPGYIRIMFRDPFGNRVELIQRA
ncbi:MAG: VOC family protein [Chloroflexota bacterium]